MDSFVVTTNRMFRKTMAPAMPSMNRNEGELDNDEATTSPDGVALKVGLPPRMVAQATTTGYRSSTER